VVVGNCKQSIRRYHYNAETDRCEEFQYSGCGGNNNNWWYKGNCEKICVKNSKPTPPSPPNVIDEGMGGIIYIKGQVQCTGTNGYTELKVPNPCPLVICDKRCAYGFNSDSAGCITCECSYPACI
jgi:hypothetical protein